MSKVQLHHDIDDNGVTLTMNEERRGGILRRSSSSQVEANNWLSTAGHELLSAVARIESALEEGEDGVEVCGDGNQLRLSHDFVARLSDAQAASLQLPAPVPYTIRLDSTGALIADDATVTLKFLKSGGRPAHPTLQGSFLREGKEVFRMPAHIYSVVTAVEKIKQDDSLDDRLDGLSRLREHLEALDSDSFSADQQIQGLKIAHGSSLSIQLGSGEGLHFDPILYARDQVEGSDPDHISEKEHLLTPRQQQAFAQAFRKRDGSKRTYLADDVFVYVDPALRVATKVIREMQDAPVEERKRFIHSPHSFVREALIEQGEDEEFVDELVESTFIITEELSARVKDLGIWKPPVIPFRESGGNDWKTIEFGIRVGDTKVVLKPDELDDVAREIAEAIRDQVPAIAIGDSRELPANKETLEAINALRKDLAGLPAIEVPDLREAEDQDDSDSDELIDGEEEDESGPAVLIVETNYHNESFTIESRPRSDFNEYSPPDGLISTPKDHQIEGIGWLQECWSTGYSGALLADDMGLGKTFQTLSFLSWLKSKRAALGLPRRPTLIVAPTSLLGTWQAEAELHIEGDTLGEFALLYGTHLKSMKTARQNDMTAGRATLHLDALSEADWILTTYETMRDYHISLAQMPFACAVFDEMQKLKNETSLMTNASRALNIDFKIGLTGTPVENSLQDLWTIMDTLLPGSLGLGSMKQFTQHYIEAEGEETRIERMSELNARMTQRMGDKPPPMIRRMKSDVAKDLPQKLEHTIDREMGQRQAESYHEALVTLREGHTRNQKVEAFHRMRSVSLHPASLDGSGSESPENFVAESARLSQTLEILDEVERRGEKALIFVESIEMHRWLATYLQLRYGMSHKPDRIYGQVSSVARQKIVDRFQSSRNTGFDVLLLSPKAAGVGLTLTAANNVIHLTRWWNPAVEDQCTDRAYRIGQTQDVNVYYPRALHPVYGERSFDGILHALLDRKRSLSKHVLAPVQADAAVNELVSDLERVGN
jgi:SNF2 family DNA or RNA helicase